jgi:phenol hydroxylase P1 protein
MDQLGIAQYLTRVACCWATIDVLDEAKKSWMEGEAWQGLRRYVEDSFV